MVKICWKLLLANEAGKRIKLPGIRNQGPESRALYILEH